KALFASEVIPYKCRLRAVHFFQKEGKVICYNCKVLHIFLLEKLKVACLFIK
ncbi:hypothetical protein TNCV_3029431, partial [Trichonephila clavipes]